MTKAEYIEQMKRAIEHAPVNPVENTDIAGWLIHCTDRDVYVCNHCVARVMARGFNFTTRISVDPIWTNSEEIHNAPCAICN